MEGSGRFDDKTASNYLFLLCPHPGLAEPVHPGVVASLW